MAERINLFVVLAHDALGDPVIIARTLKRSHAEAVKRLCDRTAEPYILEAQEMSDWWESMLPEEEKHNG